MDDIHEALANLLIALVTCHVTYLLLFKFPLARFMLFLDSPATNSSGRTGPVRRSEEQRADGS